MEILRTGVSTHTIDPIYTEGSTVYIEVLKEPIRNDEGDIIGICGICNDVTELENLKRHFEQQSLYDSLTGLYNRNFALDHAFDKPECLPCSYVFCDCNNLKTVNDTLGHDTGDHYILQAAEILKSSALPQSAVVRWGGDEFLVITPRCDKASHEEMMNSLRTSQVTLQTVHPAAGLSIGGVLRETMETSEPEAMKTADELMYANKAKMKAATRGMSQSEPSQSA